MEFEFARNKQAASNKKHSVNFIKAHVKTFPFQPINIAM